jgi:hypothetical protein
VTHGTTARPPEEGNPMTHLRFSPADYRSLCRFCQPPLPLGLDALAFTRLLVTSLAEAHPALAERVAGMSAQKLRILHDHFRGRATADAPADARNAFSRKELNTVAEACESFMRPVRVLRYFRRALVGHLSDFFPNLARKLARLSERQFARLYEHVTRRRDGSA